MSRRRRRSPRPGRSAPVRTRHSVTRAVERSHSTIPAPTEAHTPAWARSPSWIHTRASTRRTPSTNMIRSGRSPGAGDDRRPVGQRPLDRGVDALGHVLEVARPRSTPRTPGAHDSTLKRITSRSARRTTDDPALVTSKRTGMRSASSRMWVTTATIRPVEPSSSMAAATTSSVAGSSEPKPSSRKIDSIAGDPSDDSSRGGVGQGQGQRQRGQERLAARQRAGAAQLVGVGVVADHELALDELERELPARQLAQADGRRLDELLEGRLHQPGLEAVGPQQVTELLGDRAHRRRARRPARADAPSRTRRSSNVAMAAAADVSASVRRSRSVGQVDPWRQRCRATADAAFPGGAFGAVALRGHACRTRRRVGGASRRQLGVALRGPRREHRPVGRRPLAGQRRWIERRHSIADGEQLARRLAELGRHAPIGRRSRRRGRPRRRACAAAAALALAGGPLSLARSPTASVGLVRHAGELGHQDVPADARGSRRGRGAAATSAAARLGDARGARRLPGRCDERPRRPRPPRARSPRPRPRVPRSTAPASWAAQRGVVGHAARDRRRWRRAPGGRPRPGPRSSSASRWARCSAVARRSHRAGRRDERHDRPARGRRRRGARAAPRRRGGTADTARPPRAGRRTRRRRPAAARRRAARRALGLGRLGVGGGRRQRDDGALRGGRSRRGSPRRRRSVLLDASAQASQCSTRTGFGPASTARRASCSAARRGRGRCVEVGLRRGDVVGRPSGRRSRRASAAARSAVVDVVLGDGRRRVPATLQLSACTRARSGAARDGRVGGATARPGPQPAPPVPRWTSSSDAAARRSSSATPSRRAAPSATTAEVGVDLGQPPLERRRARRPSAPAGRGLDERQADVLRRRGMVGDERRHGARRSARARPSSRSGRRASTWLRSAAARWRAALADALVDPEAEQLAQRRLAVGAGCRGGSRRSDPGGARPCG